MNFLPFLVGLLLIVGHSFGHEDLDFTNMGTFNHNSQRNEEIKGQEVSMPTKDEQTGRKDQGTQTGNDDPCQNCKDLGTCNAFIRRSLNLFLDNLNSEVLNPDPSSIVTVDFRLDLSHADLTTLKDFDSSDQKARLAALSKLNDILYHSVQLLSQQVDGHQSYGYMESLLEMTVILKTPSGCLGMIILTIVLYTTFLLMRVMATAALEKSNMQILSSFICLAFIWSCVWNYIQLVDELMAVEFATMNQMKDIPKDCDFDNMSIVQSVGYYFRVNTARYEDRCHQYYKMLLSKPHTKVSPVLTISRTIAQFFGSLGNLGTSISEFLSAFTLLQQVAVTPTFLIGGIVIILFIIMNSSGWRLRTPLVTLEAGIRRAVQNERRGGEIEEDTERRTHFVAPPERHRRGGEIQDAAQISELVERTKTGGEIEREPTQAARRTASVAPAPLEKPGAGGEIERKTEEIVRNLPEPSTSSSQGQHMIGQKSRMPEEFTDCKEE